MARRLTSANAISALAIFIALGGTAYATSRIDGKSIRKGSIPANRFKRDSLTGAQVKEEALGTVPSATKVERATSVRTATSAARVARTPKAANASALGGVSSAGYQQACKAGAIKGFVKVDALGLESTYKTVSGFNCSGGEIQARKAGFGEYFVRFLGTTSGSALAASQSAAVRDSVHLTPDVLAGNQQVFNVQVFSVIGNGPIETSDFTVMAF